MEGDIVQPDSQSEVKRIVDQHFQGIAQGRARSYGDSSLAKQVLSSQRLNHFIAFDDTTGILHCESGVTLDDILLIFVPRGWSLAVVPGTKMVSVAGAIASDVHGKNHHSVGTFTQHVVEFSLVNAQGDIQVCSREQNVDLFHASCGGMGLTGIIVDVKIQLRKVESAFFDLKKIKGEHLKDTFAIIEENIDLPYSAAWLDSLAQGNKMGRSVVEVSTPLHDGDFTPHTSSKLILPFFLPSLAMNKMTMMFLCQLYYHLLNPHKSSHHRAHYSSIFNVLDSIRHWNRAYGVAGFVQYQFVLPKAAGIEGFERVFKEITNAGKASFLSVLKLCGAENENWLSFPMEGYSLALDFKREPGIFPFLDRLDDIVIDLGGRVYLAKDARLNEDRFKRMYPRWEQLADFRATSGADKVFNSMQSRRLGF